MSRIFVSLNSQSGFTLIEILVVFSIVAILAGIGMASFASYSRSQRLIQSANNIKLLVSEARFNSLSSVKTNKDQNGNTVTCGSESLVGYSLDILGSNQIELDLQCVNLSPMLVKLLTMPSGYTFGNSTSCTQIHFDSLTATGGGLPCKIELTGFGQTKTLTIDAAGNTAIQ